MEGSITAIVGPWKATWTGGSHAAVTHLEAPDHQVDALNLWDREPGDFAEPVTTAVLDRLFGEWVADVGDDYADEFPFSM